MNITNLTTINSTISIPKLQKKQTRKTQNLESKSLKHGLDLCVKLRSAHPFAIKQNREEIVLYRD